MSSGPVSSKPRVNAPRARRGSRRNRVTAWTRRWAPGAAWGSARCRCPGRAAKKAMNTPPHGRRSGKQGADQPVGNGDQDAGGGVSRPVDGVEDQRSGGQRNGGCGKGGQGEYAETGREQCAGRRPASAARRSPSRLLSTAISFRFGVDAAAVGWPDRPAAVHPLRSSHQRAPGRGYGPLSTGRCGRRRSVGSSPPMWPGLCSGRSVQGFVAST